MKSNCLIASALVLQGCLTATSSADAPSLELFTWERGIAVRSRQQPRMAMFLRFYEWNLFDAMQRGQITNGNDSLRRTVDESGARAMIDSPAVKLSMSARDDAVDLLLTVHNRSDYDWPEIASIVPCFNPGPPDSDGLTRAFVNSNTYYVNDQGLARLKQREIHFNQEHHAALDAAATDGKFAFSYKWPTGGSDATVGALIRTSNDGRWVSAIAFGEFLSAQGHNPWNCMHLGVCVGPLKRGSAKQIRGKIYLFVGTKEECLDRIRADFEANAKAKKVEAK